MPKYVNPTDFLTEAACQFDFLLAEGFVAGSSEGHRLLYSSSRVAIEVLYDGRDGRVITLVDAYEGDRNPRAGLVCLFVEAGLGPAQRIREIARSKKSLRPVLESQAVALRQLLPELRGQHASGLLLRCHGR
jgi:hypothetical protein